MASRNTNGALQTSRVVRLRCHDRRIIASSALKSEDFPALGGPASITRTYPANAPPRAARRPGGFRNEIYGFIGETGRKACDIISSAKSDSFGGSQPEDPAAPFIDAL